MRKLFITVLLTALLVTAAVAIVPAAAWKMEGFDDTYEGFFMPLKSYAVEDGEIVRNESRGFYVPDGITEVCLVFLGTNMEVDVVVGPAAGLALLYFETLPDDFAPKRLTVPVKSGDIVSVLLRPTSETAFVDVLVDYVKLTAPAPLPFEPVASYNYPYITVSGLYRGFYYFLGIECDGQIIDGTYDIVYSEEGRIDLRELGISEQEFEEIKNTDCVLVGTEISELFKSVKLKVIEENRHDYDFSLQDGATSKAFIVPNGVTALFIEGYFENCGFTFKTNGVADWQIEYVGGRALESFKQKVTAGDKIETSVKNYGSSSSAVLKIIGYIGEEINESEPEPNPNTPVTIEGSHTFAEVINGNLVTTAPVIIPQGVTKLYFTFSGQGSIEFELCRNGQQVASYLFPNWAGSEVTFTYNVSEDDMITLSVKSGEKFSLYAATEEPEIPSPDPDPDPIPEPEPDPTPDTDTEKETEKPADIFDGIRNFFNSAGSFFEDLFSSSAGIGFSGVLLVVLLAIVIMSLLRRK